jgi:hypothetical protein
MRHVKWCKGCLCKYLPQMGPTTRLKIILKLQQRKIWPKALPHYVLIFLCRHREMYYYFIHLLSSCYIMPLFLLLISPSALTLSDLNFRNTSPGHKQYIKHVPPSISSCWFFSPTPPIHFCIFKHVPCSLIALSYLTLQQCCRQGTSPVTIYVHSKKLLAMDHTMKCC